MPCDATAFLIKDIYHFMTHVIQGTRGDSSLAYARSPLKTICISICLKLSVFFRYLQKVNTVQAGHCIYTLSYGGTKYFMSLGMM